MDMKSPKIKKAIYPSVMNGMNGISILILNLGLLIRSILYNAFINFISSFVNPILLNEEK